MKSADLLSSPLFHGVLSYSFCFFPGSLSGRRWLETDKGRELLRAHSPFYQVGFMKTGTIVALEVDHYSNAGNSRDLSHSVFRPAPASLTISASNGS